MNRTIVFAALGALAMALLVAMLISASTSKKKDVTTSEILVASKDISIGAKLDDTNTHWQAWPNPESIPGALVRGQIKDDEWKEQKLRRAMTKGEPITEGALVREIKGSYMAAALEPGMRAVSIDVNAASGVAGFLSPGDRVDVILTYQTHINSSGEQQAIMTDKNEGVMERASETIVQNVRIMATDQNDASAPDTERKAEVSKTVTLEVSPKQAEQLALASQMGSMSLALRQLGDTSSVTEDRATTDLTTAKFLNKAVKNVNNPTNTIRVYTSQGVQQVKVGTPQTNAAGTQ